MGYQGENYAEGRNPYYDLALGRPASGEALARLATVLGVIADKSPMNDIRVFAPCEDDADDESLKNRTRIPLIFSKEIIKYGSLFRSLSTDEYLDHVAYKNPSLTEGLDINIEGVKVATSINTLIFALQPTAEGKQRLRQERAEVQKRYKELVPTPKKGINWLPYHADLWVAIAPMTTPEKVLEVMNAAIVQCVVGHEVILDPAIKREPQAAAAA